MFGFGFINKGASVYEAKQSELLEWIFKKFLEGMGSLKKQEEEMRVLIRYDLKMSSIIERTFGESYQKLSLRFCQSSVRRLLIDHFANDDTDKATEQEKRIILMIRDLLYVSDPYEFQNMVDVILSQSNNVLSID